MPVIVRKEGRTQEVESEFVKNINTWRPAVCVEAVWKRWRKKETHTNCYFFYDAMRRWIHWIHVTSQRIEMCGADMELFLIYSFICRLLVYDYYHFFVLFCFCFRVLFFLGLWLRPQTGDVFFLRGVLVISSVVRCFGRRSVFRVDGDDFGVFSRLFLASQAARLVRALQVQFSVNDGTVLRKFESSVRKWR